MVISATFMKHDVSSVNPTATRPCRDKAMFYLKYSVLPVVLPHPPAHKAVINIVWRPYEASINGYLLCLAHCRSS